MSEKKQTLSELIPEFGYEETYVIPNQDEAFIGISHNYAAIYDSTKLGDYNSENIPEGMIHPIIMTPCKSTDLDDSVVVLDGPRVDEAIVGVTDENRAVYDFDQLLEQFMIKNEWDLEEAMDWYSVNTERSLPYVQGSPIILTNIEELI